MIQSLLAACSLFVDNGDFSKGHSACVRIVSWRWLPLLRESNSPPGYRVISGLTALCGAHRSLLQYSGRRLGTLSCSNMRNPAHLSLSWFTTLKQLRPKPIQRRPTLANLHNKFGTKWSLVPKISMGSLPNSHQLDPPTNPIFITLIESRDVSWVCSPPDTGLQSSLCRLSHLGL